MKLEIEMPFSAADALKSTPPPPGVIFESIGDGTGGTAQTVEFINDDITITVHLSIGSAVAIAALAAWIKSAFKATPDKRIKAKEDDIRIDAEDYADRIKKLCDKISEEDKENGKK